jgi:hypothetical protein
MSPREDVPAEELGSGVHIYRPTLGRLLVLVLGLALMFFIVIQHLGLVRTSVGFAPLACFALNILTYRVILSNDAITVVSLFRRRRLELAAIAWQWLMPYRPFVTSSFLVLVPKDRGAEWLKIRLPLKTDEVFDQWLATVPNLGTYAKNMRASMGAEQWRQIREKTDE